MLNFKVFSFVLVIFLASSVANATLMDSSLLTDDHYITVTHGDGSVLDWAWVSSVSVNFTYDGNGDLSNTLYAPDLIEGWRTASVNEWNYFSQTIGANDFKNIPTDPGNGSDTHKIATYFWNDNFHEVYLYDFNSGDITSSWIEDSEYDFWGTSYYDTFYVRTHVANSVPEPASILIFALALITLASRKSYCK